MKIFFYVDSFGLGHISRQVAVIRALKHKAEVVVLTSGNFDFIKNSVPWVRIEKTEFSLNLISSGLGLDHENTILANSQLEERFITITKNEIKRLEREKPDLIVADIPAEIFVAAEVVGIPILAISNFGWTIILEHLFGKSSDPYSLYSDAYSRSTKTLVLPFSEPMLSFSKKESIGLLRREPTKLIKDELRILSVFGFSVESVPPADKFSLIPVGETESQNYVCVANAIFAKPSYGIISEAIPYGIPLFFKRRINFPESEYLLKSLPWAEIVPNDVDSYDWIRQRLPNLSLEPILNMAQKYALNSDTYIRETILSF